MEAGVGIGRRVGRDERQVASEGEVDQPLFGRFLDLIAATDDLNVKPIREQRLQPVEIGRGLAVLPVRKQPGERTLPARGQCDQAAGRAIERAKSDVRIFGDRAIEMGRRNQTAQVGITFLILGEQDQPVDPCLT